MQNTNISAYSKTFQSRLYALLQWSLVAVILGFAQHAFAEIIVYTDTRYANEPVIQDDDFYSNKRYDAAKDIWVAVNEDPATNLNSPSSKSKKTGAGNSQIELQLKEVTVKAKRYKSIGPMPGLDLTKEQIPGNVQSITAEEIKELHSLSISDLLNTKLQSVNVNDYQGNPFQMDVTYRGFTASPQLGTPQGLSVFFDGIRVNEPFGDVVNWDLIPMNAIASMDIFPGSNPMFGLNTLGGALSIKSKSGFENPGVSAEVLAGSFGRKQLQVSGGWNNGSVAAFGAGNFFLEDGWRDNSPSEVNQMFGKLEWQGERAYLNLAALGVMTKLVGNGTVPLELYNQDAAAVFTSPDETKNRLFQFQLSGAYEVNDVFNITGMVYNRASNRKSSTGDIIDPDAFNALGSPTRKLQPGEQLCALTDEDRDGFPDYYVNELDPLTGRSAFTDDRDANNARSANYALLGAVNPTLPGGLTVQDILTNTDINSNPYLQGGEDDIYESFDGFMPIYTYDNGGIPTEIYIKPPANNGACTIQLADGRRQTIVLDSGGSRAVYVVNTDGSVLPSRDGANAISNGTIGQGSGYVDGTPTGVITQSEIDQTTRGGALQLNWNLDEHKFMVGGSVDQASASYIAKQRLGILDNNRNVSNDISQIGDEFYAAKNDVTINDFGGTLTTSSAYFSETWTPTETFNFAFSGRYNYTDVKNKLAPNRVGKELTELKDEPYFYIVCPGGDLSECPHSLTEYTSAEDILKNTVGYEELDRARTEKFSYHSFNPSLGGTWQATPRLNLYANWNQGTRVPSVIELGCAYDQTMVPYILDPLGRKIELTPEVRQQYPSQPIAGYKERSLLEGRGCNLPTALSGDPYLPQVVAQTFEGGMRGKFKDLLEWNISAYQTNVRDDIYLVSVTPQLNFFQNIGATRRQGIEFGLGGEYGKSNFSINYSLTDATFQSKFRMHSANNSSVITTRPNSALYNMIEVKPGDKMPGVPLHNINASWGYKITPAWKINFTMVGHAGSFLRGNENNEHTAGPGKERYVYVLDPITNTRTQVAIPGRDNRYSGKSPGYAILNFRTTYDLGKGWTAGAIVNNLLDKEYFTAGRLGLTPFSPSTNGALGPGGFNYNSNEWMATQFMSAGAPRGIWFTLGYDFDSSKKSQPAATSRLVPEPDRTLLPSRPAPTKQELAVEQALNNTKALPILKANTEAERLAIQAFTQQKNLSEDDVQAAIEQWRKAWETKNIRSFVESYADNFAPGGLPHERWKQQSISMLDTQDNIAVEVSNVQVTPQSKGMMAVFVQTSQIKQKKSAVKKMMYFEQRKGKWQIVKEQSFVLHKNALERMTGKPDANPSESKPATLKTGKLQLERVMAFKSDSTKGDQ